jgi:hypothetical protein
MSNSPSTPEPVTASTPMGLVVFAWALVGLPLVYGLYNTVKAAASLFGG